MAFAWITARQMLLMLLYMACGFVLRRRKLIGEEGSKAIATLLVELVIPIVILRSFLEARTPERTQALLLSLGLAALLLTLSMLLSRLIFPKKPIAEFSSAFSNAGFLGIPLVSAAIGEHTVLFAGGYVALMNIFQWIYGQYHMGPDAHPKKASPLHPIVLSLPVGAILYFLPFRFPDIVMTGLSAIAGCNSPLAMILLGVYLGSTPAKQIFCARDSWTVSLVRLLVIPLVSFGALWLIPVGAELKTTMFLLASASVGANVSLYAQRAGLDHRPATGMVCLSTLLAIATMPLMAALASLVWHFN